MENKKRVVLQPEYVKEFNCIGQACEDNCCIGWTVSLDKKTYLKYKKLQHKELTPILKKSIKRSHNQKNDISYGSIKMEADKRCPLLDERDLCKIHGELGHEYLSNTCAIYPRIANQVDRKFERSATMSCPEVSRLGLLNPEGMDFEYIEEDTAMRIVTHQSLDPDGHLYMNKPQKYFWDIRMFGISLLQNRDYSLPERLISLGLTYKKIEDLSQNSKLNELPELLNSMRTTIKSKDFKNQVKDIPTNAKVQMQIVKEMIQQKINNGIASERYMECLEETVSGLGYIEGENEQVLLEKYEENYKLYVEQYLKDKEYILENFLVNEYFKDLMPFGKHNSIWDSYILLCLLYSMVKLHLIGMSGHHKGLNDDLTIKLIQSFSKAVLHNDGYMKGIVNVLKDNGYDSLAYMSVLVKS